MRSWVLVLLLASVATRAATAYGGAEKPTEQTLVYYNARMALREGHALEAIKLWFLRNVI